MAGDTDYKTMPARLRMKRCRPARRRQSDFELWSLAVSAINGCRRLHRGRMTTRRKHAGVSKEAIQQAVRIASVVTLSRQRLTANRRSPPESDTGRPRFSQTFEDPSGLRSTGSSDGSTPTRLGFVELSDGSGDAFLHGSVLAQSASTPCTGESLEVRVSPGHKGLRVTEVLRVDSSNRHW